MKANTKRIVRRVLGTSNLEAEGWTRTMRGLRNGDQRELYLGLGLAAIAFLERTKPRKRLIYRKTVPAGSAIVVHHRGHGDPKIEVKRPR